jgi:protein-disulfide isomerase
MQMELLRTAKFLTAGVALSMTVAGCAKEGAAKEQPASVGSSVTSSEFPEVLATVGNQKITLADVRARANENLERIETQALMLKSTIIKATLDSMLDDKVINAESRKLGKSIDEMVIDEAGIGVNPTDADIAAWYKANPDRVGGRPLAQISPQIADFLRTERKKQAAEHLRARLNKEHQVTVLLEPYRLKFVNDNAPTIGKKDAPVTLVEFSDFQCPFCNRFFPTLKRVEKQYGDKVQIVYRQYPIPSLHPNAFKAAEASLCANEQGKFWELHDAMFQDQSRLQVSDIKATASQLGIDRKKFDQCMETGKYVEQVQNDMKEGNRIGINGTPAVFVNGIELKGGAVSFETVAAAIDKELAAKGGK